MQKIMIIGNLAADAVRHAANGSDFITFRVGVTEKSKINGETTDLTTWYNCNVNRPDAGYVPYLTKGKKVFVQGRPRYTIYDSAVYRCKMIDVTIYVDAIELLSPKDTQENQQQPENVEEEDRPF